LVTFERLDKLNDTKTIVKKALEYAAQNTQCSIVRYIFEHHEYRPIDVVKCLSSNENYHKIERITRRNS
jgi:hypothetical protein